VSVKGLYNEYTSLCAFRVGYSSREVGPAVNARYRFVVALLGRLTVFVTSGTAKGVV